MIIGLVEFKQLYQTLGPVISGMCVAITLSPPPLVFNNVTLNQDKLATYYIGCPIENLEYGSFISTM